MWKRKNCLRYSTSPVVEIAIFLIGHGSEQKLKDASIRVFISIAERKGLDSMTKIHMKLPLIVLRHANNDPGRIVCNGYLVKRVSLNVFNVSKDAFVNNDQGLVGENELIKL